MYVQSKIRGPVQIPLGTGKTKVMLTLIPGVNEVDGELWEKAKESKVVQLHIDLGNFVPNEKASLKEVSKAKAQALVADTYSKALLEKWLLDRDGLEQDVVAAIVAQRAKLEAASKRRAEEKRNKDKG